MQPGDHQPEATDARALASALQAALAVPSLAEACRAVLREVHAVVPFAFGTVMRLDEDRATVAGLYPGGMDGASSPPWRGARSTARSGCSRGSVSPHSMPPSAAGRPTARR